jgi:uncharacterized membrane protein YhaH (DUF805 family)
MGFDSILLQLSLVLPVWLLVLVDPQVSREIFRLHDFHHSHEIVLLLPSHLLSVKKMEAMEIIVP